jgi:nicotinic acid mononucleotide adenylyltransferase
VKISDFEFRHQTKCTADVLKKIQSRCSLDQFYLIVGLDQLGQFHPLGGISMDNPKY